MLRSIGARLTSPAMACLSRAPSSLAPGSNTTRRLSLASAKPMGLMRPLGLRVQAMAPFDTSGEKAHTQASKSHSNKAPAGDPIHVQRGDKKQPQQNELHFQKPGETQAATTPEPGADAPATRQQQSGYVSPFGRRGGALTLPELMGFPAPFARMSDYMAEMQREMDGMMNAFGMPSDPFDMLERVERQLAPMMPPLSARGGALAEPAGALWRSLALEVEETEGAYVVHAEVPGFDKDEIKVMVSPEGVLTVQGEKKEETSAPAAKDEKKGGDKDKSEPAVPRSYYSRRYASFKRSVLLPSDVKQEEIKAAVRNGVLTISVPKVPAPEAPKPREIPIHTA